MNTFTMTILTLLILISPAALTAGAAASKTLDRNYIQKHIPQHLGTLKLSKLTYSADDPKEENKGAIHLRYEGKDKEIDIFLTDAKSDPEALSQAKMLYAMEAEYGNHKGKPLYVTQQENGVTSLLYLHNEKVIVGADSKTLDAAQMWAYISKLPLDNILRRVP